MIWILCIWVLSMVYNILIQRGTIAEDIANGVHYEDFYNFTTMAMLAVIVLAGTIGSIPLTIISLIRYRHKNKGEIFVFMCLSYLKYKIIAEQRKIPIKENNISPWIWGESKFIIL